MRKWEGVGGVHMDVCHCVMDSCGWPAHPVVPLRHGQQRIRNLACLQKHQSSPGPRAGDAACLQDVLRGGRADSTPSDLHDLHEQYKPFHRPQQRRTFLSQVGVSVGAITLLPLRAFCLAGILMSTWTTCKILRIGARMENGMIMSSARRQAIRWAVKRMCGLALWICGIEVEEEGLPDPDDQQKIIVCNHVSYLDIAWALSRFAPSFVAKGAVERSTYHTPHLFAACVLCVQISHSHAVNGHG